MLATRVRLFRPIEVNPEELQPTDSFQIIDVPPLGLADGVKEYLDYRRTGGPEINAWEKRLADLKQRGDLEAIETEYWQAQKDSD